VTLASGTELARVRLPATHSFVRRFLQGVAERYPDIVIDCAVETRQGVARRWLVFRIP
jgi:hypothetical protein